MQMDSVRIHWTLDALRFYKENNIVVIDWPVYSPDLNPIENVWAYKRKVKWKEIYFNEPNWNWNNKNLGINT